MNPAMHPPSILHALPFRTLAMSFMLIATCSITGCESASETERAEADSSLVNLLVDLHLADARGTVDEDPALGDSLRDLVYEMHGLDSTQLQQHLDALALRPGAVAVLTEAVETQLSTELHNVSP